MEWLEEGCPGFWSTPGSLNSWGRFPTRLRRGGSGHHHAQHFYTPTAPGIEELEVLKVSLVLGKFCVYVSQGNQTFKIILRDAILSDAKAITSLTRKMSIQKSNTYPQVDPTKLANVTSSSIRSRLIKFTCIEETFVESIDALVSEEESIPPVKRRISSSPTPAVTLPPPVLKQTSPEEASSCRKETPEVPTPKGDAVRKSPQPAEKGMPSTFPTSQKRLGGGGDNSGGQELFNYMAPKRLGNTDSG